ncbi:MULTISPECIES: AAA family ATPase [unclassified Azospirillum]|jgi:predicted ATPase|uniref:AAA family ATPase n=1 Tax=unclassified Azospirillum TaxID=2630922 RepID=UPI000B627DA9|nr:MULTISPECIES: AAA family ATPase [unclassified Azospirillum]SNS40881.1 AAA ATPase domain-containing protein [Azospirillum sp. RU38E]SNS59449.1 AAA ATPase domain-containing protein [Azospirillum sp. RU37A]
MHYIDRVQVEGFWNEWSIDVDLHSDVNFFIGENGSGKTNFINMVAASLNSDFATLDRLEFSKITIYLKRKDSKNSPKIIVSKNNKEMEPYTSINFQIQLSDNSDLIDFNLNKLIEDDRIMRHYPPELYRKNFRRHQYLVNEKIYELINTTWLTINRTSMQRNIDDKSFENSVDKKISEISENLVRYFSSLEKLSNEEMTKFQEIIFLSLLMEPHSDDLRSSVRNVDLDAERHTLIEIFKKFHISENQYSRKINSHFDKLKSAQGQSDLKLEDIISVTNRLRIQSVLKDWRRSLERQNNIFSFRDKFLNVVNEMLAGKELKINEKNEIYAKSKSRGSKANLSIYELSSGEKQLLILLSEALLQKSTPWVYITDEPELSLHVRWQSELMGNILLLNPNCQIICATHSPDIVGRFSNKIFNMRDILKKN